MKSCQWHQQWRFVARSAAPDSQHMWNLILNNTWSLIRNLRNDIPLSLVRLHPWSRLRFVLKHFPFIQQEFVYISIVWYRERLLKFPIVKKFWEFNCSHNVIILHCWILKVVYSNRIFFLKPNGKVDITWVKKIVFSEYRVVSELKIKILEALCTESE